MTEALSTRAALRSPFVDPGAAAFWCAVLATLVFANSLANGFAYDDLSVVANNEALHDIGRLPGLLMAPYWPGEFGVDLGLFRPGMVLTLGLQWAAWGDMPVLFHLVNVVGHAGATVLVVLLLARLTPTPVAFVAGLLFAVHPVHVEAVSNIVGLAEILSTVMYLGACLLHTGIAGRGYGGARLLGVTALYMGAFAVKESAVTLPAALFLLDAARARLTARDLPAYVRRLWPVYGALAAVAAFMLFLRYTVLGSIASPMAPLGAGLLEDGFPRIWTLAQVWAHYVRLLVFPLDLSADYTPAVLPIAHGWTALATSGALLALGILALALWAWRGRAMGPDQSGRRVLGFGVVWFLVTMSPVANVVFLAGVLLAERTFYLPSVGFVAILGWALVRMASERRGAALVTTGAILVLMGVRTWTRTPTWKDTETVFARLLSDYPQSGRSQWVLGDLFFDRGRISESLRAYRLAVGLLDGHYQVLTEVGKKLIAAGRPEGAVAVLTKAWRDHPQFSPAPTYLVLTYFNQGNWAEAERFSRIVHEIEPDDPLVAHAMAGSLAQQGKIEEAAAWRERAIRLGEGGHWQQWISLAGLRLALGDTAGAEAARDSALARAPASRAGEVSRAYGPFVPTPRPLSQDSTQSQDARRKASLSPVLPRGR